MLNSKEQLLLIYSTGPKLNKIKECFCATRTLLVMRRKEILQAQKESFYWLARKEKYH